MSDPFRDGMQAALERAENLEEENELLRDEIAKLHQSSESLRQRVGSLSESECAPETRVLADQALGVLDQLEVVSKRGSQLAEARTAKKFRIGSERALTSVTPDAHTPGPATDEIVARAVALPLAAPPLAAPPLVASLLAAPNVPPPPKTSARVVAVTAVLFFLLGYVVAIALR